MTDTPERIEQLRRDMEWYADGSGRVLFRESFERKPRVVGKSNDGLAVAAAHNRVVDTLIGEIKELRKRLKKAGK